MLILRCPRCHEQSLSPNGAFWTCAGCGLAVTTPALLADRAGRSAGTQASWINGAPQRPVGSLGRSS